MTTMAIGTRVHYHSQPTWLGTILKVKISGKGEEAEAEYRIRWDEDEDGEGPTWSWWMEVLPA